MNKNIRTLLFISIIFGLSIGIYEFTLPFYLKSKNISFANMGVIFSLSYVAMFFIRINAGKLSDIHGRKIFYSLALLGSAFANFFTPFSSGIISLSSLKSLREASGMVQESVHSVVLFESAKKKFFDFISKTTGSQWIFQGLGTFLAGFLILWLGFRKTFFFSAVLVFFAFLMLIFFFREEENDRPPAEKLPLSKLYNFNLPRPLKIIAFSSFIFTIGTACSHSFVMPLFFTEKFGVNQSMASVIMAIHRLLLGLPMVFSGLIVKSEVNYKKMYLWFVIIEGLIMSVSSLIPNFALATIVWFGHDYVGAAFWAPIQSTLIQRYARHESRAYDVSKVAAFSTLGWIIGPLLAGWLAPINIGAPFFVSGIIMMLSALVLIKL